MAYIVAVCRSLSQNNSTSPEAGRGWKQSPNADDGDKDTATRLEMYIRPGKEEVRNQRTGKNGHKLKDVRSALSPLSLPTSQRKKKAYSKSPKTPHERRGTRSLLYPPQHTTPPPHSHASVMRGARFEQTSGFATRVCVLVVDCDCDEFSSITAVD
jgi:hypothetical protein